MMVETLESAGPSASKQKGTPAAPPQAPAVPGTRGPAPGARPEVEIAAQPPLSPRALLRIGTDALLTDGNIGDVAFSPDGWLIAAACFHPPRPEVEIFSGAESVLLLLGGKIS
jgi:hypothetical protein